jgi:hypothetical protein
MEVALVKPTNLPEDAILSIRAGTVRRQAAVNSGRPFRFPKSAEAEAAPLKIDILKQVGSAYLVLKPGTDQYKVLFPKDPSGMELEVKVIKLDGAAAAAATAEKEVEDPKEAANGAKAAKDYLEQHQVLQFVQGVLQTVIKEKPDDPFDYMARHFKGGYDGSAPPTPAPPAPITEAKPAEAPAPAEEPKPTEAPAPAAEEAKPAEVPAPAAEVAKPAEAAPAATTEEAKPAEAPAPAAEEAKPAEAPAPAAEEAKPAETPAPAAEEAKPAAATAPAAEEAKPA